MLAKERKLELLVIILALYATTVRAQDDRSPVILTPQTGGTLTSRGVPDSTLTPNTSSFIDNPPPPPPVVNPTFTQIAAENDAQVASIVLPNDMTQLTIQLVNSIPPLWEGDISNFGTHSSPVYQRFVDVLVGPSSIRSYLLSTVGNGVYWGRTNGKSCGYHDCDRGYVTNVFRRTGDTEQPSAYPQIDPGYTESLTLYGLPAFAEIRMRTVFVAADKDGRGYSNGSAAAQDGGFLNIVDNRYASEVQVRNRPDWRIDYRATGMPASAPLGGGRCEARTITYGDPPTPMTPQCVVSLPAGRLGDVVADSFMQSERVTCTYEYVCATNYQVPNAPTAWASRVQRQDIAPIDIR